MRAPPTRVYVAVGAVVAVAILAVAVAIALVPVRMTAARWIVLTETVVALAAAWWFPVQLASRTNSLVTSTALYLATLLLPAGVVMIAVAAVVITIDRKRHVRWFQTAFNAGQYVLRVAVGAVTFAAVAGHSLLSGGIDGRTLIAVSLAGMAMSAANALLVHMIVSVQSGRWQPAGLWRLVRTGLPQEGSLLLLGVVGAMVAGPSPLLIALPLATTVLVHRELVVAARRPPVQLVVDEAEQQPAIPRFMPAAVTFWTGSL